MAAGNNRVVVIIDGPDPDNYVMALAATSSYFGMDVVAVIMTGRPVSASHDDPAYGFNPDASRAVRRDNALHAKGMLMRHGREHIPVFQGLRAPFSTVSHKVHIHERVTDIHDDAHQGHMLAGDIDDAVAYLAGLEGTLHVICGGPLTDLAYLMQQPILSQKLGIVTAQLGMFGFGDVKTIAGGRRQFNALADPTAVHQVLHEYPEALYMLPTDITKHADHGFDHPDQLTELLGASSAGREVALMYQAAWFSMWKPRGERIFVHDVHPAILMKDLLRLSPPHHQAVHMMSRGVRVGPYRISPAGVLHVPHEAREMERWGEIDLDLSPAVPGKPLRFLVDGVDPSSHRSLLASALASESYSPRGQAGVATVS